MAKLRAVAFCVAVCLLLCGPALSLAFTEVLSIPLPSWLTAKDSTYLAGGVSKANLADHISPSSFMNKEFQASFETMVGNHIPAKAACLLGTSALQRYATTASSLLFGTSEYPTFYGADHIYSSQYNALYPLPLKERKKPVARLRDFASHLNEIAMDNPDIRFVVYVVDASYASEANPARDLVSYKKITTRQTASTLAEHLTASNVTVLSNPIYNTKEYFESYYRSDHHWTMRGATTAYNTISEELGLCKIEDAKYVDIDGPPFYGSNARQGLMLVPDAPIDLAFNFDAVKYEEDGEWFSGNDHHDYFDAPLLDKEYNFYNLYWSRDGALKGPGNSNALLISDSYGDCLRRLLALNYSKLFPKLNLHENEGGEGTLAEYLEESQPTTVYFVGSTNNFMQFQKKNPQFFD